MPLKTGTNSIRQNVRELMSSVDSPSRKKAIMTIAKKNNISYKEAQFKQAIAIAKTKARQ